MRLRIPDRLWLRLKKLSRKRLMRTWVDPYLARQSLVPVEPILDERLFPFLDRLEASWTTIRAEFEALRGARGLMPRVYELQPDNYRISADDRWTTFLLRGFGQDCPVSQSLCPETWRLVRDIPELESAYFSILAPGASIPRHRGLTKALVRVHLGLIVPKRRADCSMAIDKATIVWEEGQAVAFDDTFPHEVHNNTDQERVVLLIDFERPMRRGGRLLGRLLLGIVRRTRFVRDARTAYLERERQIAERLGAAA